jgi:hypothetical protein
MNGAHSPRQDFDAVETKMGARAGPSPAAQSYGRQRAPASRSCRMPGATLFENIWRSHMVRSFGERALIHIDRHFVHEGTSRNAFDGLRNRKRGVKNLELTFGVIDHAPST